MHRKLYLMFKTMVFLTMCSFVVTSPAWAETPAEKGRRLMETIDSLPVMEKMTMETVLDIYDGQGKKIFSKKSRAATFNLNFRDKEKRLMRNIGYFYAPADDKGNASLMIEIADSDDDQWVYLKGLRKPKRIVGSDKSSSFMGSDFSNGDVGARDIDDSDYVWLAAEKVPFKGKSITTEKIESTFKNRQKAEDYGYSKTIVWMHPKSGLPFQMEYYDMNGQLAKKSRLLGFTVKKNRDGKKVYFPTGLEMQNVLKGTKTVMKMKNIKAESDAKKVNPGIFKIEYMTRRWW